MTVGEPDGHEFPDPRDMFDLEGRLAVLTGASGMLGDVFARTLLGAGADVVLVDVDGETCLQRAEEYGAQASRQVDVVVGDISSPATWERVRSAVLKRRAHAHVLVNGAGITNASRSEGFGAKFAELPLSAWEQVISVNLTGAFLGCQVLGALMVEKRRGSIVNVASLYGVVSPNHRIYDGTGIVQPVAYSVSKAGLLGLTRYLATMWADEGVRVNAITPGGVFDEHEDPFLSRYRQLCPAGRMADRWEMSGALLYLASEASAYCTGHNPVVDGGWTAW